MLSQWLAVYLSKPENHEQFGATKTDERQSDYKNPVLYCGLKYRIQTEIIIPVFPTFDK